MSTTSTTSSSAISVPVTQAQANEIIPGANTLVQAARLAIQLDRPILVDYYVDSFTNNTFIGEDAETKEKVLVKSKEEFTSLIQKFYKVGNDFLILTENSLYVVSGKIQKRKINLPNMNIEPDVS